MRSDCSRLTAFSLKPVRKYPALIILSCYDRLPLYDLFEQLVWSDRGLYQQIEYAPAFKVDIRRSNNRRDRYRARQMGRVLARYQQLRLLPPVR